MGPWDFVERKKAEALGLELAPVSLQQLIIYLTNGKTQRKAVEV
jgi:ABC-2 type transport system ATP-binding protein